MTSSISLNKRLKKEDIRLLSADQYDQVFQASNIKQGNKYILFLAHRTTLPYARLGLVVAKKKIPLAVNRNRFKRLAREHFQKNLSALPPVDLIILARQDIKSLPSSEQNALFERLFKKLRSDGKQN